MFLISRGLAFSIFIHYITMKLICLSLLASIPGILACGFTTHQVISHRAYNYYYIGADPRYPSFAELIGNQIPSMEAGAPYPDYLYECGTNHSDGEYSHWAPFQANLVTYIRQTYGIPTLSMDNVTGKYSLSLPWNISGQKLSAFGFGVVSHYIADISWHGLAETPNFYGLIETIGGIDYNDTGPGPQNNAHTLADNAGEFTAAYETMLNFLHPEEWYIPVQDLLNTYALAGITDVTAGAIEECAAIFFTGSEVVKALAALVEPLEVAPSPTFAESYIDMPLGGIDDMAIWTSRMWQRFAYWLVNGNPTPIPGMNYHNYSTGNDTELKTKIHRIEAQTDLRRLYRIFGASMLEHNLVSINRNNVDGSLSIGKITKYTKEERAQYIENLGLSTLISILNGSYIPSFNYKNKVTTGWTVLREDDYNPAIVAKSLAKVFRSGGIGYLLDSFYEKLRQTENTKIINKDDPEVLLSVLSHIVEVKQYLLQKQSSTTKELSTTVPTIIGNPSIILASTVPLEYVGQGLTYGDYDHDGLVDMVFTAYGHSGTGTLTNPAHSTLIRNNNNNNEPNITINGNTLLPQSGGFYTRYGNFSGLSIIENNNNNADINPVPIPTDYSTFGTDVFTRLGWDICTFDINADGIDDIAVSAPTAGWSWADAPSAPLFLYPGKVYIYMGANNSGIAANEPDIIFYSPVNDTHLGMKLTCADVSGDNIKDLLIGSPFALDGADVPGNQNNDPYTATQAGRVDVVLSSPSYGSPRAGTLGPISYDITQTANYTIGGSGPYEWLGYSIAVLDSASSRIPLANLLNLRNADVFAMYDISYNQLVSFSSSKCSNEYTNFMQQYPNKNINTMLQDYAPISSMISIGSPGYRAPADGVPNGRITNFALPLPTSDIAKLVSCMYHVAHNTVSSTPLPFPSPLFSVTADPVIRKGPTISTKFSADIAIGYPFSSSNSPYIAVGIPNVDFCNSSALLPSNATAGGIFNTSAGAVLVFELSSTLRGNISYTSLLQSNLTQTLLASSWPDSHYGWHLRFQDINNDNNDDLFIGAPMYTSFFIGDNVHSTATDSGHEAGSLLVYLGGTTFPAGYICEAQYNATWRADGDVEFGRFGTNWIYTDYNGDGTNELLVSAPRAYEAITQSTINNNHHYQSRLLQGTTFIEMPGAIYIYSMNLTTY